MQQINVQYSLLAKNRFVSFSYSTEDVFGIPTVKFELIVRIVAINMMKNEVQCVSSYTFIRIYRGIKHIVLTDPSVRDKSV